MRFLGRNAGYGPCHSPVPLSTDHCEPKEVVLYEIEPHSHPQLGWEHKESDCQDRPKDEPPPTNVMRSLFAFFSVVADLPKAHDDCYPFATLLALAVAVSLVGYRSLTAHAQFAPLLNQKEWAAAGVFFPAGRERYTPTRILGRLLRLAHFSGWTVGTIRRPLATNGRLLAKARLLADHPLMNVRTRRVKMAPWAIDLNDVLADGSTGSNDDRLWVQQQNTSQQLPSCLGIDRGI